MNRDDIVLMAKKAGFCEEHAIRDDTWDTYFDCWPEQLEQFFKAAYAAGAAAEREWYTKTLADIEANERWNGPSLSEKCIAAIRARGETK